MTVSSSSSTSSAQTQTQTHTQTQAETLFAVAAACTSSTTSTTSAPHAGRADAGGDGPAPSLSPARRIEVVHLTRYDYTAAVSASHHAGCLQPLQDAGQTLEGFRLDIDPEPTSLTHRRDDQGQTCVHFQIDRPHGVLQVRATSRVRVRARFDLLCPDGSPAWEAVAERLRYVAARPFEPASAFAQPSPYVPRLDALRAYAAVSFAPGRPVAEAAIDLMQRVHRDFAYRSHSTDVDTPLGQVLEQRAGVCQDFAHLMCGALRMMGLSARYVSGYLLTRPAGQGPALVGADASHAWVQVWCPGTPGVPADGWLDLDPTNDLVPSLDHVRVAVGRDYGDVAPLRGVIRGGGAHRLTVGVTTRQLPEDPGPNVAFPDWTRSPP
jgi:transglutaminase-like putative cysteine protease